jgi:hypothetical protein
MTVLPYLKAKVLKIIVINVEPLKNQGQIVLIYFKAIHLIPHSFGMPSGFVRDFANNGSFFRKRDSKLSTYPSYTLNVPSGLLESIFLLASFFLPSFYPLFCIYQKNIFHTIYHKFRIPKILLTNCQLSTVNCNYLRTFKFQISIFKFKNCQLQIVNCNIRFAEPSSKLPSCYPLTIPTFNIRIDLDAFDLQKTS